MLSVIRDIAIELSQIQVVESVILYGSRARGTHWERSDIDLAIVCPTASSRDWLDMTNIIDEAPTLLKIDLVIFGEMQDEFKNEIDREGIVLYERERKGQTVHT